MGVAVAIVDPVDQGPFDRHAPPLAFAVLDHGLAEVVERVAAVDRHQLVAKLVAHRVKRDRQIDPKLGPAARLGPCFVSGG